MNGDAGLKFHHLGLAALDPQSAVAFVRQLGYTCATPILDPLQNVYLRWCEKSGAPSIEIVSPTETDGPLATILASHPTSFYHICYEVDSSSDEVLNSLSSAGLRVLTVLPPTPAILFGGRLVSFHFVRGFGLIELVQSVVIGQATQ